MGNKRMEQYYAPIAKLSSELIFEILSRLPAKSLVQCKCVCKSWYSLIRDPLFVRARQTSLNQNTTTTNLFLASAPCRYKIKRPKWVCSMRVVVNESGIWSTHTNFYETSCGWWTISISNLVISAGLVCHYRLINNEGAFRIFNPSTGELVTFPMPPRGANIALGFNCLTNEYKVLQVEGSRRMGFKFKILTLASASLCAWRDVPELDYDDLGLDNKTMDFSRYYVCIHGAIHWQQYSANTAKDEDEDEDRRRPIILAFDVGQERFRVIPVPKEYNKTREWRCHVIEVNGCVALFNIEPEAVLMNGTGTSMDFWILKDYQNQVWFKDSIVFPHKWYEMGMPYPICSLHTGELLLSPIRGDKHRHGYVHLYDMKLKTYNKTDIVLPEGCDIAGRYDETIFPLKGRLRMY